MCGHHATAGGSESVQAQALERRAVLSQWIERVQEAGTQPPSDTGLTVQSWHGMYHGEMTLFHLSQWALWGRQPLIERCLGAWNVSAAKAYAAEQGFPGARWWKETTEGRKSSGHQPCRMCKAPTDNPLFQAPSEVAVLIIHQQTHPIAFAELAYRAANASAQAEVLHRYWQHVNESAIFMASFANESYGYDRSLRRNDSALCLNLGPPQFAGIGIESSDPGNNAHNAPMYPRSPCEADCYNHTWNSMYELVEWRWGLEMAQTWRQRRGLARDASWDTILRTLCAPQLRYLPNSSQPVYFFDDGSQGLGLRRPSLSYTLGNLYACSYLPCEKFGVDSPGC